MSSSPSSNSKMPELTLVQRLGNREISVSINESKVSSDSDLDFKKTETLFKLIKDQQVPIASSCQADGVCGKCKVEILSGAEYLTRKNETEVFLSERFNLKKTERMACQTALCKSDDSQSNQVKITTGYW